MMSDAAKIVGFVCAAVAFACMTACSAVESMYGQSYHRTPEQQCAYSSEARSSIFCVELARRK